jgi:hypothetical protein
MEHYEIQKDLDKPFVEHSRYVLAKGTESEKHALANGIETRLIIKDGELKAA